MTTSGAMASGGYLRSCSNNQAEPRPTFKLTKERPPSATIPAPPPRKILTEATIARRTAATPRPGVASGAALRMFVLGCQLQ